MGFYVAFGTETRSSKPLSAKPQTLSLEPSSPKSDFSGRRVTSAGFPVGLRFRCSESLLQGISLPNSRRLGLRKLLDRH